MKVIIIREECHGTIGVATSIKAAVKWLIESTWLEAYTEGDTRYNKELGKWVYVTVLDKYGENWKEVFPNRSEEEIKNFLEGGFCFTEYTLHGAE